MTYELDALGKLLPLSWRGIEVPCAQNSIKVDHSQVAHYQVGVNGAHVEHTCRHSAVFQFRVFFRGGISGYTDLFPSRYREFLTACMDGSTGPFIHPDLGLLDAKVQDFTVVTDPNRRDGYDMDVNWIETVEAGSSLEFAANSPISEAISLGRDLETNYTSVDIPPYDDGSGMSLTDALKSLQGQWMLMQYDVVSMLANIDNMINAINGMLDTLSTSTDPNSSAIATALKGIIAAMAQLEDDLVGTSQARKVGMMITQRDDIVASVAASVDLGVDEFFLLNPRFAETGKVPTGSTVFFYES